MIEVGERAFRHREHAICAVAVGRAGRSLRAMRGYDAESYGEAFADVYDDWYAGITDVDVTVRTIADLADRGQVLELGTGTGRLAVPLAAAGLAVTGIDTSPAMLDRLAARDPDRPSSVVVGDMVDDLPPGRSTSPSSPTTRSSTC